MPEVLVVPAYGPDEGIVADADTGMDRRLVGHDKMRRPVRLTHEVKYACIRLHVKTDIDLRAAVMHHHLTEILRSLPRVEPEHPELFSA